MTVPPHSMRRFSALLLISQPVGMAVLSNHPPKNIHAQTEALLRSLLALTLPASAFLVIFSTDIVRLVYFRGAFGEEALLVLLLGIVLAPGLLIQNALADLLFRLFVGGLAYLLCLGFAVGLLMPAMGLSALNRVRRTFWVKGELS